MAKPKTKFTATIILQDTDKGATWQLIVDPDIEITSPEMERQAWNSQAVRAALHLMKVLDEVAATGAEI